MSNTKSMSTSSPSQTGTTGNRQCKICHKVTRTKPTLSCACCKSTYHASCLPNWNDASPSELKVFEKPGVLWYCESCYKTLPDYILAPDIKSSLDAVETKIDNLSKLICENVSITKSYALAASKSPVLDDFKSAVNRIEERFQKKEDLKEKGVRKLCAVVHGLEESSNDIQQIDSLMRDLSFSPDIVTEISRLGKRNLDKSSHPTKARPIKLKFTSEVNKIDFMRRFNKYKPDNSFATPDLSKEEQEAQYQLRVKRRALSSQNPKEKYQIRNGSIYLLDKDKSTWVKLVENHD